MADWLWQPVARKMFDCRCKHLLIGRGGLAHVLSGQLCGGLVACFQCLQLWTSFAVISVAKPRGDTTQLGGVKTAGRVSSRPEQLSSPEDRPREQKGSG